MRGSDRDLSNAATRGLALFVCLAFVAPPTLASCAEIEGSTADASAAIDFNDLWSGTGYPCAAEELTLVLSLIQQGRRLNALSVTMSDCVARGDQLWQGTLPAETIRPADLPITFDAVFTQRGAAEQSAGEPGAITVLTPDRMLLVVGELGVVLTRGARAESVAARADARATSKPSPDAGSPTQPSAAADGLDGNAAEGRRAGMAGSDGATTGGAPGPSVAGSAGMESGHRPPVAATAMGGHGASGASGAGGQSQNAGSAAPDEPSTPAAGGGGIGGAAAGSGPVVAGAGAMNVNWACFNFGTACSCVPTDSEDDQPVCQYLGPCCYKSPIDEPTTCQCRDYEGAECDEIIFEDRMRVPTCP